MNRQRNQSGPKQVSIETMLYRMMEVNTSVSIVVLTYISIVVLICCRTVVWKYRRISAKKQGSNVVNNSLSNDLQQHINNYSHN